MPLVVLIGPPGSGKSTVGALLAHELGVSLYDTDTGIETHTGRSIPEIFATDGEAGFRRFEERVVHRALAVEPGVLSLGGGAVLSPTTRARLRGQTVVYLEVGVATAIARVAASAQRPLLTGDDPAARFAELMRVRDPIYRELATVRVSTDGHEPAAVVRTIRAALPAPTHVTIPTASPRVEIR
ncbi:shikimate kinase [Nocardia sp. CDC159]|uniref:Shikimate kinase n=1 Tax=Nocardia pulmonis TaxID=2951408 RepID=A0A9X2EBQ7_9NOCA|nr:MULTISPECIES: shikimate kinase [Nocardia]MCM6775213.1 shikimate kinase [Nocardia pulmonis]MCM6789683.1 shikimate kinase [Nocardia sp. CDC159]